jgi:hypothetical protein
VCLRRWYIFGIMLLMAFSASRGLGNERVPVYASTGNFAVIYRAPADLKPGTPDPRDANPLAAGGGTLLKQSIVNDLRSANSQRELAPQTLMGTDPSTPPDGSRFAVETAQNSATVTISTWGTDKRLVRETVTRILGAAAERAKTIQDSVGAPATGRLTTFVTLPTQTTELPPPSKIKLMIAVMGVGVIAGAALSLLYDRLMTKRKLRRRDLDGTSARTGRFHRPAPPFLNAGPTDSQESALEGHGRTSDDPKALTLPGKH